MQPVAKQAGHDIGRQRRGQARRADRRQGNVRRHDAGDARFNRRPERYQFHRVELGAVAFHHRQREMRVGVGVAVAGKVFRRGRDARALHAADERRPQVRYRGGVLAERSRVDDRVGWIVVHIDDGRECKVNADRPGLDAGDAAGLLGVRLASGGPDGHVRRQDRRAAAGVGVGRENTTLESTESRFDVRRNEERHLCQPLERVDFRGHFERRPERHHHAADAVVHDPIRRFDVRRVGGAGVVAEFPDGDHLGDASAERQAGQGALDPPSCVGVQGGAERGCGWGRQR